MRMTDELQASLAMLNDEQRQAVEHLDGPLLVVAGPGTGKTQLLSLRTARILAERDAAPDNILCLTYTEAGAEAMRKRLIELIGRDAYGIQVSTFHGFANSVRCTHPERFPRPASDKLVTPLCQAEIMDGVLGALPFGTSLSGLRQGGTATRTVDMLSFVSTIKRNGLAPNELLAIVEQNGAAAAWLEENSALCDLASQRASKKVALSFGEEVERACSAAPAELKRPVVATPGVYMPFVSQLLNTARQTELIDEDGKKTTGYAQVRDAFFVGNNKDGRRLGIKDQSERLAMACRVAQDYQAALDEQHLFDFDDMVYDFIRAVGADADLRQTLQDSYTYIQVDEFQDTNGAQMRMLDLLCDGIDQPNIMAVGDDDQAIMRFQGASVECIDQFRERYRPRCIVLRVNYRSTPAIVDLGQKVAGQIGRRLRTGADRGLVAARPEGDQTAFSETVFASKAEEYAALAASIRARIDAGYGASCDDPDEAIAVISPRNAALKELIPYLVAQGIPFSYRQTQNLFDSERLQTTLATLRCVAALSQGRGDLAVSFLPQIVAAPELGGDHVSSVRFALWARRAHHGDWLSAMAETDDARIRGIYDDLMGWAAAAPSSPVRELLFKIAARPMDYYRQLEGDPLAAAEFNAGMRAMLGFVEGELNIAGGMGRTLRLADVVDRLEAARLRKIDIDAGIDLKAPGAVRLTTAHSSKGLEFDCVYLLDADDMTWHNTANGTKLYPSNLLIGNEKDGDDATRLLFVAATRAKRHLELFRARDNALRELAGEISSTVEEADPHALDTALETDWHGSYRLDTPELIALLDVRKDIRHLSASSLNAFVTYEEGCANSTSFPERQVMRLPEEPKIYFEFGTIVHALMEDVTCRVLGPQGADLRETVEAHRKQVAWMDFSPSEVAHYLQRFDRICATFVPWLMEHAAGYRRFPEVKVSSATAAGTPLYGRLDLILADDATRTLRIIDYKTGFNRDLSDGYRRQLAFYKLMVESSPAFEGYTVVSMGDYYVEPDKGTGILCPPNEVSASVTEMHDLERLVDTVWERIRAGAWDTSAFEQSDLYREAHASQGSCKNKAERERVMQQAYEAWLVGDEII